MSSLPNSTTDYSVAHSTYYQKNSEQNKPSMLKHAAAGAVALTVASPTASLLHRATEKAVLSALDNASQFNDQFKRAAELAFNDSGLASKGVRYVNAANLTGEQITNYSNEVLSKWVQKLPTPIKEMFVESTLGTIKSGKNAIFLPGTNQILVNTEKLSVASFHEMGHAMNKFSKIGNILQKCASMQKLSIPIILIAAFKPKKAEGEKANGVIDKTTTFIKNNAGKLAFATFLPTLLEEGLASVKAAKIAKPHLSADMFKKLNIVNGKAFLTHLGVAAASALTAKAASWIHDKIASPKKA